MRLRPYAAADRAAVVDLWRRCELVRPWNDPDRDIERKLAHDPSLLIVADDDGEIVGSVMVGYEGHRGWLNYLAVDPARRGTGLGREMVHHAEEQLAAHGCPKVNLQVRADNPGAVEFYRRLGYELDDVVAMGKRLSFDDR